jgi:hypothetical protein
MLRWTSLRHSLRNNSSGCSDSKHGSSIESCFFLSKSFQQLKVIVDKKVEIMSVLKKNHASRKITFGQFVCSAGLSEGGEVEQ